MNMWVYWFPLLLAVGLTSAVVGRPRGAVLSVLAAGYWIVLAWSVPAPIAGGWIPESLATLGGAAVIAGVGIWMAGAVRRAARGGGGGASGSGAADDRAAEAAAGGGLGDGAVVVPGESAAGVRVREIITRFEDWLDENRTNADPWPEFGEFVQYVLAQHCGARHVRCYRLLSGDEQLHPLRRLDPEEREFPNPRTGLLGHVATTGRSYYHGDSAHGELVAELARREGQACAWCFAVKAARGTIGVVRAGELDCAVSDGAERDWLAAAERLVALCWIATAEACRGRAAGIIDPVTGVLTREAFTAAANRALRLSYDQGEPVAVVCYAVEGLRALTDQGRWEAVNELLGEISATLQQRIRQDDQIGVVDGFGFLLLLRRVDSELAALITQQIADKLTILAADENRWGAAVTVRCGLAGSGMAKPPLRTLMSRAMENCREARRRGVRLVSDLPSSTAVREEAGG